MNSRIVCIVALVLLPLAAPTDALHCNGEIITISVGSETVYIDDRSDEAGEINHWTYLESNDVEGLQSGGDWFPLEDSIFPSFPDPCAHGNPDTLIL